ncbi:PAS domain-containing sensor histidine kinase [Oxalobacteraceae bacterium A2-2]
MPPDYAALILNETPDAVIITTPDGEVLCWTNGAAAVFGYSSAEAVGRSLSGLIVPPGQHEAELGVLHTTLEQGQASYESLRRAKDGALVYIDSTSKLIRDEHGQPACILWSKKDVTGMQVRRDAKLAEARFGDLLESSPDAIVMANTAGRVVLANSQAESLFGYDRGGMQGLALEDLMPARLRANHANLRDGYFAEPRARPMGSGRDLSGLRRDGSEFPIEISLSPIAMEVGSLVMSAIRDVSERRRIELALQEKNVELGKAVAAKDRFLAGMSHELRTPLNAIIGFTGTMLMKLPGPLTPEQEGQLRTIQGSARHLLSLINDLLDLTQIESGKVELLVEPVSCRALIDELLRVFKPQARQKGLALEYAGLADDVVLQTDKRAVQQILMNLVNNAIKFTEAGKVLVRLDRQQAQDGGMAAISVSDSGPGIAPAQRGQLFQAFSQLDGIAHEHAGAGLGLHLSRKLAGLLRGDIVVESEYGNGSTFTLVLPLA